MSRPSSTRVEQLVGWLDVQVVGQADGVHQAGQLVKAVWPLAEDLRASD